MVFLRCAFDLIHPGVIVEIAGKVLFPVTCGKKVIPHPDHIREINVVTLTKPVIALTKGIIQTAA